MTETSTEPARQSTPPAIALDPAQRDGLEQAWNAAAALLEAGAQGAGAVLIGELLRAVHSCRVAGLHRLAAAGVRTAQAVRDLDAQRPEFRMDGLVRSFHDMLSTAHALRSAPDAVHPNWIGTARRPYAEVGSLQLAGVFTEAIATSAGFAGVVSYLADPDGVIWSIADVAPGDADRCAFSYVTPIDFGSTSIEHRALCRESLQLQHATAAANHRLGAGRRVMVERAAGFAWTDPRLAPLWNTPLTDQLDQILAGEEPASSGDLLFVRCTVVGPREDALELVASGRVIRAVAPTAHAELAYRHNLRMLATAPGLQLLAIGRIAPSRPRTLLLLAVGGDGLDLPPEWHGRANLGLDRLEIDHLQKRLAGATIEIPTSAESYASDPLDPLKRRLQQVVLGGRPTLSQSSWSGFVRDEHQLARNQMPTAVEVLQRLRAAPVGDLDPAERRTSLALAWLAGRTYVAAAEARLQRLSWLD